MCSVCLERGKGWQGWNRVPAMAAGKALGPWVDLSHPVGPDMPCASIFPRPALSLLKEMPADPFNVTALQMVVHAGTHVDAPRHYYLDGPAFEDVPLERLHGPGVVWRIDAAADAVIDVADLELCRPELRPGDMLALDTGWAERFGSHEYERHPSMSPEAAAWLAERDIKMLACDFATPDLVYHLREPGFDWPVHRTLLSRGILICEHLTGHAALAGKRVEFMFGALPIRGSDGAPARVVARLVAD
ncbi:cyclase family protein [Mesorhizobium sp. M7A.F.Ca.US.006.01.1.1]|uniref:cyclase family protein n=1 Tax=Mesorhizobium sp. M7A.F.Ca.US.006.01.1.1 TaxID=2496707 RepID=UPI000FCBFD19|nr:cyclase family protein [Mesorhizobium sp. M7A.F.Ca.US.006.01.1.1]RUZ77963.1 cyclase family protein [Mesorhizobium sp. M7A.F.Ca.US.006.01.1.1]